MTALNANALKIFGLACLGIFSTSTYADEGALAVRFIEGAPKDQFVITNKSACNLTDFTLSIDMTTSAGKLIFDTTETGLGVEVFQPLEIVAGSQFLKETPEVKDGDQSISLAFADFSKGATLSFTIDTDDQQTNSALGQIRVTDAEITDTTVTLSDSSGKTTSTFGGSASAVVNVETCGS